MRSLASRRDNKKLPCLKHNTGEGNFILKWKARRYYYSCWTSEGFEAHLCVLALTSNRNQILGVQSPGCSDLVDVMGLLDKSLLVPKNVCLNIQLPHTVLWTGLVLIAIAVWFTHFQKSLTFVADIWANEVSGSQERKCQQNLALRSVRSNTWNIFFNCRHFFFSCISNLNNIFKVSALSQILLVFSFKC